MSGVRNVRLVRAVRGVRIVWCGRSGSNRPNVPNVPNDPNDGFTLIELMIVMVIIVLLAGIGLAVYGNTVTRAKEAALSENLFEMRNALDQYYADKQKYPASLEALVDEKYIRKVPVDPFTSSADTWQLIMSEPDPTNPSAETGVFNVKSGAEQTAINGTSYADW